MLNILYLIMIVYLIIEKVLQMNAVYRCQIAVIPKLVAHFIEACDRDLYPNIKIFLQILRTLPTNVSTTERSFSNIFYETLRWINHDYTTDKYDHLLLKTNSERISQRYTLVSCATKTRIFNTYPNWYVINLFMRISNNYTSFIINTKIKQDIRSFVNYFNIKFRFYSNFWEKFAWYIHIYYDLYLIGILYKWE